MGFRLNVTPAIVKAIMDAALSKNNSVCQATSSYIDDIYVNENMTSADHVKEHLATFRLTCKDPEWLQDGSFCSEYACQRGEQLA